MKIVHNFGENHLYAGNYKIIFTTKLLCFFQLLLNFSCYSNSYSIFLFYFIYAFSLKLLILYETEKRKKKKFIQIIIIIIYYIETITLFLLTINHVCHRICSSSNSQLCYLVEKSMGPHYVPWKIHSVRLPIYTHSDFIIIPSWSISVKDEKSYNNDLLVNKFIM